jgi:chitin synthase
MVKGAGNDMTTPEICLSMMKDFVIPPHEVEPHSYVAIADGHKRHNMAKVYAGFYDYNNASVEVSKQQRVPMVVVAKVGNPLETNDAKPGNRGKRDSQIVLMAFLQKVMFDERMTTFEYEFFNSIWRVTGVSPDRYELVLCVDADTKVFPDSLTRMVSCMVVDIEIMGLCGETKIANKADNFVTMMQVFEYYISHHMTKAFEAMFGGVTCLPGCFSMYRIKAPKGDTGYWVPVLANPDIVERYSENVVDTLHKKNLLLLGEDRYLTTLLLMTFPRRKNMFCPQAVCKTIVPDTFRVLLSQRRRWINSTIHNLFELVLVRDLCGTFCFSMQFVVGMELMGTLVLPAAISFTLYLIIISIIPGGANTTIPLTLLAIVLGLPGLLIVVTSRKVAYVGWMIVYLISLPIWNGLLPAYAFWHFDDFSWGQTRQVAGDKGGNHGDKEGEFDSSHIVMKRWAEFERDRRWKNGAQSRDSTFNRYSMASNSDVNHNGGVDSSTTESTPSVPYAPGTRSRHDSNGPLTLPAPLYASKNPISSASSAASEDVVYSDGGSTSNQRLVSTPQEQYIDSYTESPTPRYPQFDAHVARAGGVLRNQTISSQYPGETQNPFRSEPHVATYDDQHGGYSAEPEDMSPPPVPSKHQQGGRGVSLSDNGPVPGPEGVRRVARPSVRRPPSQAPQNRYSRSSTAFNLPPGAAPPQPGGYGSGY